jgi:type IV pilus assembly protein PilY1
MTKTCKTALVTSALLFAISGSSLAEDIDIYATPPRDPGAPNVLIVLDSSGNWGQAFGGSTKFAAEKAALAQIVNALNTQFNLGLMMYTESGGSNTGPDGGYVRFAIQPMSDANGGPTNARNCLLKMIGATPSTPCSGPGTSYYTDLDKSTGTGDGSNSGKIGKTMAEAYFYFAGVNAYTGNNKTKADPLAFTSGSNIGPTYKSPIGDASCAKNFIIVINNGPFSDSQSDTADATSRLSSSSGNTAVISPPDNGSSNNNEADEWTRFLHQSDVQAITYTVEVGPVASGKSTYPQSQGFYNTALLQSMGREGKGGYYSAIDAQTLLDALTRIFNDIKSVNSVFASSSLPLSADNSGAFSNQVYMGVFRPDAGGNPRWLGNLKQYKFAADSNRNLTLVDANGQPAGGASGFAQPDAVSFWTSKDTSKAPDAAFAAATNATTGSTGGFYFFDSKGSGLSYDSPDGEWVEKGGAAEQLRLAYLGYGNRGGIGDTNASTLNSLSARKVYTCTGTCLSDGTLTAFDNTNTTINSNPGAFGISSVITVSRITSKQAVSSLTAGSVASVNSVTSLTVASSVAMVTTSSNHGYKNGDYVTIDGSSIAATNGTFQIVSTGNKSFTYPVSVISGTASGTITATQAGTTATVTTPVAHNISANTTVTIAGAVCPYVSPATSCALNGTYTVLSSPAPTSTTFSYTLASPGVGATATGTITVASPRARVYADTYGYANNDSVTIAGAGSYNGAVTALNVQTGYFEFTYSGTPLADITSSGITATNPAAVSRQFDLLLKWVRGQDTQDENGFKVAGANTDVRASIHGDVLHMRPAVINYGTPSTSSNVYVFYGGNDGVFRAVKGGQAATDGKEQWAFIPQEFFGKLRRQFTNSPTILFPSTPASLTPTPAGTCDPTTAACAQKRDYFWDGPVNTLVERNTDGTVKTAILYIGTRRGGRFIYALDVKNPSSPKFLWRKGCTSPSLTDDSTCDSAFTELGQTWSTPQVATVHDGTDAGKKVLIFGGGYDTAEDADSPPAQDTKGRVIFVLDAATGAPLWSGGVSTGAANQVSANVKFSIAGDVLVVDRNSDGFADRVYAADIGGNVWRADIQDADMSKWKMWHIASVGDRNAAATTRKFLFGPDVVFGTNFDAVVIGSGDREHPLAGNPANSAVNRVYMFEDPNTGYVGGDVNITESQLANVTSSTTVGPTAKGWFFDLAAGEKVINGPLVLLNGTMVFGTNQPDTSDLSCPGNLGIARRYAINFLNGGAATGGFTDANGNASKFQVAPGGGFLPSPVEGVVEIPDANGVMQRYMFAVDNPLNGPPLPNTVAVTHKRFRTYWHEVLE